MTGISFTIPDSEMKVIQVDGGQPVASDSATVNSVGILYPGERVDLVLGWSASFINADTEIIIELDNEYE
jgi:hypothetical protein